jgi:hypothetical protein
VFLQAIHDHARIHESIIGTLSVYLSGSLRVGCVFKWRRGLWTYRGSLGVVGYVAKMRLPVRPGVLGQFAAGALWRTSKDSANLAASSNRPRPASCAACGDCCDRAPSRSAPSSPVRPETGPCARAPAARLMQTIERMPASAAFLAQFSEVFGITLVSSYEVVQHVKWSEWPSDRFPAERFGLRPVECVRTQPLRVSPASG